MKFKEIFSKEVPKGLFNGFVLYDGPAWYSLRDIGTSYLTSADKLIEPFRIAHDQGREVNNDDIAHPCIFLYRHSLESFLKYYMIFLIDYNSKNKFFNLKSNWEKIFYENHKLKTIADFIWKIVREPGILQNKNLNKYMNFFDMFDQIDSNSTAFRYSTDTKGRALPLYDDQWYVNVLDFSKLCHDIKNMILGFTDNNEFEFEKWGYLDQAFKLEIEPRIEAFHRFKKILDANQYVKLKVENVNPGIHYGGVDHEEFVRYGEWKTKFISLVKKNFSSEELVLACEGMYFGRDAYYPIVHQDEALGKLIEKRLNFDSYVEKIKSLQSKIRDQVEKKHASCIFDV